MNKSACLGFPRIGSNRELKKALEAYWRGDITSGELENTAKVIRKNNWTLQKNLGIDYIPSNDFSLYDQVLDTAWILGAVPDRFDQAELSELDKYFAMARGNEKLTALEMTKWFDTNYHYIVPELKLDQEFKLRSTKIIDEYLEAKDLGIETRPVLIGPVSFLLLAKTNPSDYIAKLLPVYEELLTKFKELGCTWLQIDEPCLGLDLDLNSKQCFKETYARLNNAFNPKLMLTSYFSNYGDNLDLVLDLTIDGLHIDCINSSKEELDYINKNLAEFKTLSLGLVDGRNVWINDLNQSARIIEEISQSRKELIIASSSSLLHVPIELEESINATIKPWLAFAKQKLSEISLLAKASSGEKFTSNKNILEAKSSSILLKNKELRERIAGLDQTMFSRQSEFSKRKAIQEQELALPLFPTTTIGSLPQTKELREQRAKFKQGKIDQKQYNDFLEEKTKEAIQFQEEIDLDVLVHGEFERNDMVEFFGEKLEGILTTKNGWVQSYGSRCVKAPIIYGDITRAEAMTIDWTSFAQRQTNKYLKGMLTGPVTILKWSFVRNDQALADTAIQIALALRDEVADLENEAIKIIQIDEPAFREAMPLKKSEQAKYFDWAIKAFKLASSGVKDQTQIHSHMCYSEFDEIIEQIAALDADVISIECSRSNMQLLDTFVDYQYQNDIGPGIYDIHSPRIPGQEEIDQLIGKAEKVLGQKQIWINPDCGLKTRSWTEVKPALEQMVKAAKQARAKVPV